MGRMDDALRKAAEERQRKRRQQGATPVDPIPMPGDPSPRPSATEAVAVERPVPVETGVVDPPPRRTRDQSVAERALQKAEEERRAGAVAATPASRAQAVDPRIVTFHAPRDPRAEQVRGVRTSILSFDPIPRSIAVTSGSPGEGKSLTAVNLAASLVEGGRRRVLLVDANLRFPELASLCGAEEGLGLSDLMGGIAGDPVPLIRPTGIPGVELLSAGRCLENPGSLLNPRGLSGVLGLVEDGYDFVIVDTPALDEYADAAVLAPEVDGTILVCQVEGPPRNQAEKALDLLAAARARVLGVVATNCRS